jgi:hypothetical protein
MNDEFDSDQQGHAPGPELPALVDGFPPGQALGPLALPLARCKVERIDRAVARAMEQVPLPEGLSERILGALPIERRSRFGRRRMLIYGTAATVLFAVGLAFARGRLSVRSIDYDTLIAEVGDAHRQLEHGDGETLNRKGNSVTDRYFCPSDVVTNSATRWLAVRNILGRKGAVYELTNRRGVRATLYVLDLHSFRRPVVALPTSPPVGSSALGHTAGAWTEGNMLFVLLVEGDVEQYQSFLHRKGGLA